MAEKTRYSDAELEEFRAIINEKLELAQRDYELLKASLTGARRVVSSLDKVLAPSSKTLYVGDVSSVSLPSAPVKLAFSNS